METRDIRGCPVTGASDGALRHYENALELFQLGRGDPLAPLALAIAEAPDFAMARILEGYLRVGGRDPSGAERAAEVLGQVPFAQLNYRERGLLPAPAAAIAGEYEATGSLLGSVLSESPRDVVALQVAHSVDYVRGEVASLKDRVAAVLPAWSRDIPGYHAVLAMHAFGLEENGEFGRAQETALQALELEPLNVRAHHTVAHVLEMQGRATEGASWMQERQAFWATQSPMATHQWWHYGLFRLGAEDLDGALAIYDTRLAANLRATSDLIDASALLWRLHLRGLDLSGRWRDLAEHWAPHAADAYCAFSDMHAMMAFAGAERADLARTLMAAQAKRILKRGTNSEMTRLVGLPASRALLAFARGEHAVAEDLLSQLPPIAHRIGGSQAQRDVLDLTRTAARARIDGQPVAQVAEPDRGMVAALALEPA
jgi:tetratricopeptide (TPR) repeat protein